MPRAARYLDILEGRIGPESEGPQMFPSLRPLPSCWKPSCPRIGQGEISAPKTGPHSSASSGTAGERWEMHCVVVWPSPLVLAAIQMMNRHQAHQVPPRHSASPAMGKALGWEAESGQCHWEEVTSTSLSLSCPSSPGSPEVSSPPVCEMVQRGCRGLG